jgi:L-threonylcarbamoyladenylate synthase
MPPRDVPLAEEIAAAVDVLRRGGLVAFPTETVYGLGADATNPAALDRLFRAKGRPRSHPLIVHLAEEAWIDRWAADVPEAARRLARRFWPGPLTLILERAPHVLDSVTGGQDTIGLRVPAHPIAHALLAAFGSGIAAPSANRFGHVSPTTAGHVREDLGDAVDIVIDGGACEVGIESAIVDASRGALALLRPGVLTRDAIRDAAEAPVADADDASPRVPGSLSSHYAPRTPLELVPAGGIDRALQARAGETIAVLAFQPPVLPAAYVVHAPSDAVQYAHALYATLRQLDALEAAAILVEAPPDDGAWAGVTDRLRRAAHR